MKIQVWFSSMRLVIGAVGKMKGGSQSDLFHHYLERARVVGKSAGFSKIDIIEVSESSGPNSRRDEALSLQSKLPKGSKLFIFDECGVTMSSRSFAQQLQGFMVESVPCWCGIIGGAGGIHAPWRDDADAVIALGQCTLPHQLVRIIVAEQLYRSATILTGHPYHRD